VSKAFDRKLQELESIRNAPDLPARLTKALKDRNNFLVAKAAAMVAEARLKELIPNLARAFETFFQDPVKSDPQCWAKTAIVKALKDLDYDEHELYLRGLKHVQMEPVFGGRKDTAATLRGTSALALAACPLPRTEILKHLLDLLAADPEKTVRGDAARAIGQLSGIDSVLILRMKALAGDPEPEVVGQCLTTLLDLMPNEYVPFVATLLDAKNPDIRIEAAGALGECREPQAVDALKSRWPDQKDPEVRRAMLLSLSGSRHDTSAGFLLSVVMEGRQEDALNAIRALASGRFRDEYRDKVAGAAQRDAKLSAAFHKDFGL
jgi:HEAT repeat protein